MLLKLGFARGWTNLILKYITISSFSVLVNGVPHVRFQPHRGLRQGCPLSPYIFILCAEVLSSQLQAVEHQGLLTRVPIAEGQISMSHLFVLVDDSILFCGAAMEE